MLEGLHRLDTSFQKHIKVAFVMKLLTNELPTLDRLTIRNSATYGTNATCFLCHSGNESLNHLWHCPTVTKENDALSLYDILTKVFAFIETLPIDINYQRTLKTHYVWNTRSLRSRISLSWLIRGFIPKDFVNAVNDGLKASTPNDSPSPSLDDARTTAASIICQLQSLLYKHRWLPRCRLFNEVESLLGITSKDKRSSKTAYTQTPTIITHTPYHLKWLEMGITHAKWQDFSIGTNYFASRAA